MPDLAQHARSEPIDSAIWPTIRRDWRPEARAYRQDSIEFTYGELLQEVDNIARGLVAAGIGNGTRVASWLPNWWENALLYLACTRIGAVYVPVSTWLRAGEVNYILRETRPSLLFAAGKFLTRNYVEEAKKILEAIEIPACQVITVRSAEDHSWDSFLESGRVADLPPETSIDGNDIALIQFTSGSTAHPKGVALRHSSLLRDAYWVGKSMRLTPDDRFVTAMPYFHVGGTLHSLTVPFLYGCSVVTSERFDAGRMLAYIEETDATVHVAVGTMLMKEMQHPDFRPYSYSLRVGHSTGTPGFLRKVADQFIPGIGNLYGLTEATACVSMWTPEDPIDLRMEFMGRPFPGLEVRIDGANEEGIGEICVRGWSLMAGYLDPKQTDQAIDADGWLHTGDIGRLHDGDIVKFLGRIKNAVRVGGENVSLEEVESALERHPAVRRAAATGVEDELLGEVVAAFIVPGDHGCAAEEVYSWIREEIAGYKVPRYISIVDALPETHTSKVDREALRVRAREAVGTGELARLSHDGATETVR